MMLDILLKSLSIEKIGKKYLIFAPEDLKKMLGFGEIWQDFFHFPQAFFILEGLYRCISMKIKITSLPDKV